VIRTSATAVLLDIEGTTSSVRYVYDVLFPYARQELAAFLDQNWNAADVAQAREMIARDAGAVSFAAWTHDAPRSDAQLQTIAEVGRLMDADAKATGLKELQGLIWRQGYESGLLKSHVYADVPPALAAWTEQGVEVRIYSSGSVAAQRLFFAHTEHGDLTRYFRGHYDTTTGPKRESASYTKIAADMSRPAGEILFLSDVTAELDAARTAGVTTGLVVRPGNAAAPADHGHPVITDFTQVVWA
jgi:enolase-phosphatase E1